MFELTDSTNYTFGMVRLFISLWYKLGSRWGSYGIRQSLVKLLRMRLLLAGSL